VPFAGELSATTLRAVEKRLDTFGKFLGSEVALA
jgi:hypothetical protein